MTVVDITKGKGSPMFERIDDPQLRERALAAQQYLQGKYSELGTWKKVARAIRGVNETSLVAFNTGSYAASPANIVSAIERAKSAEAANTFVPAYAETSVARRIGKAVRQTMVRGQLGTIAGDSGIGKTTAFAALVKDDPSILYVRCNPTLNARLWPVLAMLLRSLAAASHSSPTICYDRLTDILRSQRRLVVIDEAQLLLRPDTFDTLRTLSEDTATPILFSGNQSLHEFGFLRGAAPAAFTQFTRRCAVNETISRAQITRGDVTLLAGQRLEADVLDETLTALHDVVRSPGAFGALHLVIQRAHEKARGGQIEAAQVFDAISESGKRGVQ